MKEKREERLPRPTKTRSHFSGFGVPFQCAVSPLDMFQCFLT